MQDLLNTRNELNVVLRLSITAPDEERAEKALALAEQLAQRLPQDVVREVLSEIEQDHDLDNCRYLRAAVERLADGESDEFERTRLNSLASSMLCRQH